MTTQLQIDNLFHPTTVVLRFQIFKNHKIVELKTIKTIASRIMLYRRSKDIFRLAGFIVKKID
jgi:hypothetical protein